MSRDIEELEIVIEDLLDYFNELLYKFQSLDTLDDDGLLDSLIVYIENVLEKYEAL